MIDMMFRYGQNSVMYMDGILKLVLNNFKISKSALRRIMKDLFMLGTKFSKVTIHLLSIVGTLPDKRQQLIVSTLVDWITTFFYDNLDALNPLIVKRHDTITAFTDFISSFFELQLSRPIFSNAFHTFASSIISTIKIPKYEIFGCIILQNFLDLEYKYRDHIKGLIDEFIDDTYANIPDNLERILCSITPKNEYLYQTPTLRLKSIQDIVFGIIFVLRSKFLTKINTYTAIAIWQALRNYATEAELEYTITLFTKLLDHELLNVDFIPRIFKILVTQDGSLYLYHRATQDFHWKVSKALIKLNSMFLDNEMYKKALYSDDSHLPACWELITKSFDLELVEIGMECIRQFYQLSIPKELEEKSDQIAFKFAVDLKNAIAVIKLPNFYYGIRYFNRYLINLPNSHYVKIRYLLLISIGLDRYFQRSLTNTFLFL
ncbi:hypothetical protein GJ496_009984 [Pomphorhynchus laevis]|nr:hypothetical protein GJ496_009984 [Pomphorhynchus laevis]